VRETILNILAAAALKDDIILVLHQDRREHILMNYANGFDKLPLLEQLALTLFVSILRARITRVSEITHCSHLTIFRCAICSRTAALLNGYYTYLNGSWVLVW